MLMHQRFDKAAGSFRNLYIYTIYNIFIHFYLLFLNFVARVTC